MGRSALAAYFAVMLESETQVGKQDELAFIDDRVTTDALIKEIGDIRGDNCFLSSCLFCFLFFFNPLMMINFCYPVLMDLGIISFLNPLDDIPDGVVAGFGSADMNG